MGHYVTLEFEGDLTPEGSSMMDLLWEHHKHETEWDRAWRKVAANFPSPQLTKFAATRRATSIPFGWIDDHFIERSKKGYFKFKCSIKYGHEEVEAFIRLAVTICKSFKARAETDDWEVPATLYKFDGSELKTTTEETP